MKNLEDVTQKQSSSPVDDDFDSPANLNQIKIATGGNTLILHRLVEHLLHYYPGQLQEFKDCVATGAWPRLMQAAHKFKGAVANFGARKAASYAYQLENAGQNKEREQAMAVIEKLEQEMARVQDFFNKQEW